MPRNLDKNLLAGSNSIGYGQARRMSNYRPLLLVYDDLLLLVELQKERNPWFAEVASFTINSDNDNIERDAKSVVEAYN